MLLNRQNTSSFGEKSFHHSHLPEFKPNNSYFSGYDNLSPNFMVEPPPVKQYHCSKQVQALLQSHATVNESRQPGLEVPKKSSINPHAPPFEPRSCLRQPLWWTYKKSMPPPPPANAMYSEQRYKTELCRQFDEIGQCEYGERCLFAHGLHELKAPNNRHPKFKTERCSSFHEYGFCSFGLRCSFIHEKEDPLQVIEKAVQAHKKMKEIEGMNPQASFDPETGYVWGSGGRLPMFQKLCPTKHLPEVTFTNFDFIADVKFIS